ncbi:phage distal tail protein, Rcc01695 family [Roseibium sp.]|uniref:phage distal tail protein, Rcc01695 family n=1 Tax=Roseibium sp. TaxID=1936156 RepID=UPI003BAC4EA1
MPDEFHDVRFPDSISLGSRGGPERKTVVVALASGKEQRNQQWQASRRRYDAGYGIKQVDDLNAVIAFFEERRGRLSAFRWKDWADYKSCDPSETVTATDQHLGIGDGVQTDYQLIKTYGAGFNPYVRTITKPVPGSARVALNGALQGGGFVVNPITGRVSFSVAPGGGVVVTAGFEFDVPARFDTDYLDVQLNNHRLGSIPTIPIVEVLS